MNIKTFVLSHKILYELYFFLAQKKINRKLLDKKIDELDRWNDSRMPQKDLIVSLTSYGERLPDLKYTLFSLVMQTIKPERIVVWLGEGEKIPEELLLFEQYGVKFKFCKDIRSYKKLVPSLLFFQNKNIVTADDDILYPKRWLEKLWDEHKKYPEDKITHIAHEICFTSEGTLSPYRLWKHNVVSSRKKDSYKFPTGGGGILYPPFQYNVLFLNENIFLEFAPSADDVWFYFMGLLSRQRTRIVKKPYNHLKYVDVYKEYGLNNKMTLQSQNVEKDFNDVQIHNVLRFFNIQDFQSFLENQD